MIFTLLDATPRSLPYPTAVSCSIAFRADLAVLYSIRFGSLCDSMGYTCTDLELETQIYEIVLSSSQLSFVKVSESFKVVSMKFSTQLKG